MAMVNLASVPATLTDEQVLLRLDIMSMGALFLRLGLLPYRSVAARGRLGCD